jgi:hypothetical protein
MRVSSTALVLGVLLAAASPVRGAPDADTVNKAKAHFKQGTSYQQAGMLDDAIVEYEAAYALVPEADFLFNIAQCHRLKGDRPKALDYYRRYLEAAPDGKGNAEAREHIVTLTRELREEEARASAPGAITVVLPADAPAGTVVRLDGAEAAPGAPLSVAPGPHRVEVRAPGRVAFRQEVEVAAGAAVEVTVLLAVIPPRAPSWWTGRRIAAVTLGGVGVAGLAAGAVFGLMARSIWKDVEDNCFDLEQGTYCPEPFYSDQTDARTYASLSTITFAVGGAALVAGAILYFTAPRAGKTERPGAAVTLVPTTDGAALVLSGGF